nr:hypothetical protein [Pseudomonas syringae pv. theae]
MRRPDAERRTIVGIIVPPVLERSAGRPSPLCANLFAKGPVHPPKMRRLKHRLREQVRSHGLRPEACKLNSLDCV